MDRSRFVGLAALSFALVFVSFLVRGTTRLVASYETATLLSAPLLLAGAALAVFLFARGVLDVVGIRPIE